MRSRTATPLLRTFPSELTNRSGGKEPKWLGVRRRLGRVSLRACYAVPGTDIVVWCAPRPSNRRMDGMDEAEMDHAKEDDGRHNVLADLEDMFEEHGSWVTSPPNGL
eukprot:2504245-Rhodomonas_salina.4